MSRRKTSTRRVDEPNGDNIDNIVKCDACFTVNTFPHKSRNTRTAKVSGGVRLLFRCVRFSRFFLNAKHAATITLRTRIARHVSLHTWLVRRAFCLWFIRKHNTCTSCTVFIRGALSTRGRRFAVVQNKIRFESSKTKRTTDTFVKYPYRSETRPGSHYRLIFSPSDQRLRKDTRVVPH